MSTIASPRDPSTPFPRRVSSALSPASSSRPSLETPRSLTNSPNPSAAAAASGGSGNKRASRAALREYYNLKKPPAPSSGANTPLLEVADPLEPDAPYSEVPGSELDAAEFDAEEFVRRTLADRSLEELLRIYTRILVEIRALDAEKKALVYDNYSKLISATETIRKMRANMDPLNPMASTLDLAIAQIYSQASSIRETLRKSVPAPDSDAARRVEETARRKRTQQLAREVLATPERLRNLVKEGKRDEARREWEMPRRLLQVWKENEVGGDDVDACLEEGDAVFRESDGESSGRVSKDDSA